jgi:leader peptidase (prepilin peptidase)/N-methyltransferase
MTETALYAAIAGVFGLLIGSFLNVCIYRWTRDLSVVKPRSACPECNHPIAGYDNVPILSFFLLKGKCRHCRAPIPWTYPAVELLTALFFAYFVAMLGVNLLAARDCLFAALMIGLIFSDLDTRLLPDQFTLGGLFLGLVFALFVYLPITFFSPSFHLAGFRIGRPGASLAEALLGSAIPCGAFWLLRWIFEKIRHVEGAGLGDVKMIAMMGAFLGIGDSLLALTTGSVLGSVIGIAYIKIAGKDHATYGLPMATFLGIGGLVMITLSAGPPSWHRQIL